RSNFHPGNAHAGKSHPHANAIKQPHITRQERPWKADEHRKRQQEHPEAQHHDGANQKCESFLRLEEFMISPPAISTAAAASRKFPRSRRWKEWPQRPQSAIPARRVRRWNQPPEQCARVCHSCRFVSPLPTNLIAAPRE